ncbi:MAG: hypothetical protein JWM05_653 [Acidimicrobiales bacterium]|nr:hypothetical protein [Acidimicrobiales bacterium]
MTTSLSPDVKLTAVDGDTNTLSELLTNFQLVTVVLDPYTNESAWLLETAGRILEEFSGADCRVSWVVTADEAGAKQFLGPWASRLLTFVDPTRSFVKAVGLERLPALVHIRQNLEVVATAEGWDPPAWDAIATELARQMSWSRPSIPPAGAPGPFHGSPAAG